MTVSDFLLLVRRYITLIIIIPLAFAVVSIGWSLLFHSNYSATATLASSFDLQMGQGYANAIAEKYSYGSLKISVSAVPATRTLVVTAQGEDANACIEAANDVVNQTLEQSKAANRSTVATVSEATYAVNNSISLFRLVPAALILGFLFALCLLLIIDGVKTPIKSSKDFENSFGLPLLGRVGSPEDAEELFANLQFRCDGKPSTVAVIPVGDPATAPAVSRDLAASFRRIDYRVKLVRGSAAAKKFKVSVPPEAALIVSCEPLDAGMGAAYIANGADAVVLTYREWSDSKKQFTATLKEVELAKANIVGAACLPEDSKAEKERKQKNEQKPAKELESE